MYAVQGMITPFHKLDGFDRSIQAGGPSRQPRQQLQQQPGTSEAEAAAGMRLKSALADEYLSIQTSLPLVGCMPVMQHMR